MCRLSAGAGQCRQSAVEASRYATRYDATCRARQGRVEDAPSPLFFFPLPPSRPLHPPPAPLPPLPSSRPPARRVRAGRRATCEAYASKIRACRRCRRAPARRASVPAASRAHGGKERKAKRSKRGPGERRGEGRKDPRWSVPARARKSHGDPPTAARRDASGPTGCAARRFSSLAKGTLYAFFFSFSSFGTPRGCALSPAPVTLRAIF